MSEKRRIVVTSALPYANGDIHLGHLVEYIQTDFWVRFQKMRGNECVYVCADDTHGTPIMIRARAEGITPEELIARSHALHLKDFTDFEVAFDNYYTTNSPENRMFSEQIFAAMEKSGAVTTRKSPQLYCEKCKMFLPDRFVKGTCPKCGAENQYGDSCDKCGSTYAAEELGSPVCTTCGSTPVVRESEHLYFELEPFKDYLRAWLPEHTTSDVSNKLLEWFNEPLRGWCISRDAPYFGFEIPGHPGKFFYVWVDAPIGYRASLANWCEKNGQDINAWWPGPDADAQERVPPTHFIGKDIIRFHCLFWPGMLHVAGIRTPDKVFVHGFLTVNGEKMSKSKGTFVNARTYLDHLPAAALRYYYACKLSGTTDDMDLNLTDFVTRVNSDMVGKITNLASRGAQMLNKPALGGTLGALDEEGRKLVELAQSRAEAIAAHYEARTRRAASRRCPWRWRRSPTRRTSTSTAASRGRRSRPTSRPRASRSRRFSTCSAFSPSTSSPSSPHTRRRPPPCSANPAGPGPTRQRRWRGGPSANTSILPRASTRSRWRRWSRPRR